MKRNKSLSLVMYFIVSGFISAVIAGYFYYYIMPNDSKITSPLNFVLAEKSENPSSHSLVPVKSNQWYSTLFNASPTEPVYANPLSFRFIDSGIEVSYPKIKTTTNTIFASHDKDFTITDAGSFAKPEIDGIGDWTVKGTMNNKGGGIQFTIGHGLPYILVKTKLATLDLAFGSDATFFDQNGKPISLKATKELSDFRFVVNNKNYLVLLPASKKATYRNRKLEIAQPENLVIAVLPSPKEYAAFLPLRSLDITDSQAEFHIQNGILTTTYKVQANKEPLLALYPHQRKTISRQMQSLGEYETLRGALTLVKGKEFTTTMNMLVPDSSFVAMDTHADEIKKQLSSDITSVIKEGPPNSKAYYLGRWFGKVSTLILLADTYNMTKERENLLQYVRPIFLKSLDNFTYSDAKTSVIEKSPEFGNEELNDHHFHYGYFIRAASVFTNFDPSLYQVIDKKVQLLVDDVSTMQRDVNRFPYLRNFDIYESHSWADGDGAFADGNNQESSSEAINAWYALYLWSGVTKDENLERYSLYLYNAEITGAKEYWFNTSDIYSGAYDHEIASIVWGGKVDYATWFSDDTNMKYGIQLLPITPASAYLGTITSFSKYENDFLTSGGSYSKPWGDLMAFWKSFSSPETVIKQKDSFKDVEDKNTRSVFLQMIYTNLENFKKISPTVTPESSQ